MKTIYILEEEGNNNRHYDTHGVRCCIITVPKWDRDLSPWEAPAAFRGGEAFEGKADDFLFRIISDIVPAFEAGSCEPVADRILVGYSLAGLFALYALYKTTMFKSVAAVSGSYWYDGFVEFAKANEFAGHPHHIYLSLGDKEAQTKNARMAKVQAAGEELAQFFGERGVDTKWELNPGNHFVDVEERIQKAIDWILGF